MNSDNRFRHIVNDPRFKTLRKKHHKVKIDDRFKSMFTDDRFNSKNAHDKRGQNTRKKTVSNLERYYSLTDDDSKLTNEEGGHDCRPVRHTKTIDELGNSLDAKSVHEEKNDDDQSTSSSSSDESESDAYEEGPDDSAIKDIEYDWTPLDHDAEMANSTFRRLAIQNLDWDHLCAKDLYTLVNSVRRPIRVGIYLSDFGKQRIKDELDHGPVELVEAGAVDEEDEEFNMLQQKICQLDNFRSQRPSTNDYEDADEAFDSKNETIRAKIRKYQLNKMRYYYAIAEFESIESAELVYKELDGLEYEGSSIQIDIRFVPDDIEFHDHDLKDECTQEPDLNNYKAPQFINSALQQTKVRFTWDETDVKRQQELRKAYTRHELEKDDLDAYLGSDTDSDASDINGTEYDELNEIQDRSKKYKALLEHIAIEDDKKKSVDVHVEWGDFVGDELEVENQQQSTLDRGEPQSSDDMYDRPPSKKLMKISKKMKKMSEIQRDPQEERGLDLLVINNHNRQLDEFNFNPEDERFLAIYESGLYNIDPSNPNFKPSKAFETIASKKRNLSRRH